MTDLKRILIISRGSSGKYMSSPGIRAFAMARVLKHALPDAEVTLAVPNLFDRPEIAGVRTVTYGFVSTLSLIAEHDIIISSGFSPHYVALFPHKKFVVDLFSMYFMEWMELTKGEARDRGVNRKLWMNESRTYLPMQLTFGDFVLCANERQRDSYIGMLSALGLIDPIAYDHDDSLRRMIDVAPHGVRPEKPHHDTQVFKGVFPGVKESDTVIIWNGGTVHWYDPEPFLQALHLLSKERDDIKALFLGVQYPGLASLGTGSRFKSALQLSKELNLYDRSVFFVFDWVPHEEVKNYLMESNIGLCTYFDNSETHFSHRTRFLDLFWAELPIICTHGDILAEMVDEKGLGIVVPPGDVTAIADAIRRLVDDKAFLQQCVENLRSIKPALAWEVTLEPLVRFCRDDTSYAVPKADRFLPLLSRIADYTLARLGREASAFAETDDRGFIPFVSPLVWHAAKFLHESLRVGNTEEQ